MALAACPARSAVLRMAPCESHLICDTFVHSYTFVPSLYTPTVPSRALLAVQELTRHWQTQGRQVLFMQQMLQGAGLRGAGTEQTRLFQADSRQKCGSSRRHAGNVQSSSVAAAGLECCLLFRWIPGTEASARRGSWGSAATGTVAAATGAVASPRHPGLLALSKLVERRGVAKGHGRVGRN